jgi:ABC-2 type transport system permease protein
MTAPIAAAGIAYYNMLPGIFMGVYAITVGNKLISSQVDRGTLAYVLSNPVKRSTVIVTQVVFFAGSLLAMCTLSAVAHSLGAYFSTFGANSAEIQTIFKLNLGLFTLALSFAGIVFAASCLFNLSKYTIAVGGGIVCAFLLFPIMAMFGSKFAFLSNLTVVSLYKVGSIMASGTGWAWDLVILAAIGLVAFAAGGVAFVRRDLPL